MVQTPHKHNIDLAALRRIEQLFAECPLGARQHERAAPNCPQSGKILAPDHRDGYFGNKYRRVSVHWLQSRGRQCKIE